MKLNKKIKYSLSILGLTGITVVPLSLSLIGCSKTNDSEKETKESKEINQDFEPDFLENTKNLTLPPKGVDDEQYNFLYNFLNEDDDMLTQITKKRELIDDGYGSEQEAKQYAEQLLKNLDNDSLKKMLLLNFNKDSFLEKTEVPNGDDETLTASRKLIYTFSSFDYNSDSKVCSFVLEYHYDSTYENIINKDTNNKINQNFTTHLTIKFDNLKLIPEALEIGYESYIPILTIDTKDESFNFKYIESSASINIDEYLEQQISQLNTLKESNRIDENSYNKSIKSLQNFKDYWYTIVASINNISNLDFNNIEFVKDSKNLGNVPFFSKAIISTEEEYNDLSKYKLSSYNIGTCLLIEIINNDLENYKTKLSSIVNCKLGIPVFNFIEMNNGDKDFNFVFKDPNAIPRHYR
ncbi:MAG: hypothetical protein H9897_00600 [Candidatus Ureaplasma intestinipullorum]|uniref:Lipoprotein n=1 Tax=Candidatus Ureaplasma intestinipullorum TaxID=2838770 RepID=A0A9E2KUY9_9BACT|nr:hypothetical protein [Candidatus Ureaplasma intestinipullorum]